MNRADILATATTYVTKDRNATHGEPENSFADIARLWTAYLKNRWGWEVELDTTDVALMATLLKVARATANPGNADNWIDGAGYLACGGELATRGTTE